MIMRLEARSDLVTIGCMRRLTLPLAALALAVAVLSLVSCSGSGPTAPPPPMGEGNLFFVDSGCACVNPPWDPITIYVDGRQAGQLPIFGHVSIPLPPGPHTWDTSDDSTPTSVVIQTGATVNVHIYTNLSCADGCPTPSPDR